MWWITYLVISMGGQGGAFVPLQFDPFDSQETCQAIGDHHLSNPQVQGWLQSQGVIKAKTLCKIAEGAELEQYKTNRAAWLEKHGDAVGI